MNPRSSGSVATQIAKKKLLERSVVSVNTKDEKLEDFIIRVSPKLSKPMHLGRALEILNESRNKRIRLLWSVPPRHGKSYSLMHLIAQTFLRDPTKRIAYISYGEAFSEEHSRQIRQICEEAGVELSKEVRSASFWKTAKGGSLTACGVGGGIMGKGFDLVIVDDPYKSRPQVESELERMRVRDYFYSAIITRLQPNASIVVLHCIAKNEKVLLADGSWKNVQDVLKNDTVLAYENNKFIPRRVVASKYSGHDDILKISTARKELRVNGRHPFLLESGEWCKASDLSVGDKVVVATTPIGEERVDSELAWLFGFMMGDGWTRIYQSDDKVRNGKRHVNTRYYTCVAKGIYPELNERVLSAFEHIFGTRLALTNAGYYRTNMRHVAEKFVQLGLVGGAYGKRVPEWVFRLAPDLKIQYLRGHADADGSYPLKMHDAAMVASVSRDLIDDLRRLAISAGVRTGRITKSVQINKAPNSKEASEHTCYKVLINFSRPPESIETIRLIEQDGSDDVYDLMVEGAENFVANGFVVHNTRYHPDDLIGYLWQRDKENPDEKTREGWEYVNMPAIDDDGKALWPEQYSVEELNKIRARNEYEWSSMYQGQPRPRGGAVFNGTAFYDELPDEIPNGQSIGIDLAYTAKTYSDYSVLVSCTCYGDKLYITNVRRKQCEASVFAEEIRTEKRLNPSATVFWWIGGIEKGIVTLLKQMGLHIRAEVARADKFVRAQAVASAWNQKRVLLPKDAPWLESFVSEVLSFTGVGDVHDDQVDALAAAYDPLLGRRVSRGMGQVRLPIF